jgi:hypothetical protein
MAHGMSAVSDAPGCHWTVVVSQAAAVAVLLFIGFSNLVDHFQELDPKGFSKGIAGFCFFFAVPQRVALALAVAQRRLTGLWLAVSASPIVLLVLLRLGRVW